MKFRVLSWTAVTVLYSISVIRWWNHTSLWLNLVSIALLILFAAIVAVSISDYRKEKREANEIRNAKRDLS